MPIRVNPVTLLERSDKWSVAGGTTGVFAPEFPVSIDAPGFWDRIEVGASHVDRLFCLIFLSNTGVPMELRRIIRRWNPACFTQLYTVEGHPRLRIQEERVVSPDDTFVSRITITNTGAEYQNLNVVMWSLQREYLEEDSNPRTPTTPIDTVVRDADAISYELVGGTAKQISHFAALGGSRMPDSLALGVSNATALPTTAPLWEASMLPQIFQMGQLSSEWKSGADDTRKPCPGARGRWRDAPDVPTNDESANEVSANEESAILETYVHSLLHFTMEAAPGESDVLMLGANVGDDRESVLSKMRQDMAADPLTSASANWQEFFGKAPYFECGDSQIERLYWHRWQSLRTAACGASGATFSDSYVLERPSGLRRITTSSAASAARELSWYSDRGAAQKTLACVAELIESLTSQPMLHGLTNRVLNDTSDVVDVADAAVQVARLSGNTDSVGHLYPLIVRHLDSRIAILSQEQNSVVDGDPESSSFIAAERTVSCAVAGESIRSYASIVTHSLITSLAVMAKTLGESAAHRRFVDRANRLWQKMTNTIKDETAKATGGAPVKWDLLRHASDPEQLGKFREFLAVSQAIGASGGGLHNSTRASAYRSSSAGDGDVGADTACRLIDALAHIGRHSDPEYKHAACAAFRLDLRSHFLHDDLKRACSYDYYNIHSQTPSVHLGCDSCQIAWPLDMIMRHVVGIDLSSIEVGVLIVDPLPLGLKRMRCEGVMIRGYRVDVIWSFSEGYVVRVNGIDAVRCAELQRVEIPLP